MNFEPPKLYHEFPHPFQTHSNQAAVATVQRLFRFDFERLLPFRICNPYVPGK